MQQHKNKKKGSRKPDPVSIFIQWCLALRPKSNAMMKIVSFVSLCGISNGYLISFCAVKNRLTKYASMTRSALSLDQAKAWDISAFNYRLNVSHCRQERLLFGLQKNYSVSTVLRSVDARH